MIDKEEIEKIDPNAGGEFAMYVPSSGILDPMAYTIALAENACMNGVKFHFGEKVVKIDRPDSEDGDYRIHTRRTSMRQMGDQLCGYVCAGDFRDAWLSELSDEGLQGRVLCA